MFWVATTDWISLLEPIPVTLKVFIIETTESCVRPVKKVQNNPLRVGRIH